jgi:hypothetical protein
MQRVHPDRMACGLDLTAARSSLEHSQLDLELRRVPPKSLEGIAHALGLVAASGQGRQLLDAWERRQGGLALSSAFSRHRSREYGDTIGGIASPD